MSNSLNSEPAGLDYRQGDQVAKAYAADALSAVEKYDFGGDVEIVSHDEWASDGCDDNGDFSLWTYLYLRTKSAEVKEHLDTNMVPTGETWINCLDPIRDVYKLKFVVRFEEDGVSYAQPTISSAVRYPDGSHVVGHGTFGGYRPHRESMPMRQTA